MFQNENTSKEGRKVTSEITYSMKGEIKYLERIRL